MVDEHGQVGGERVVVVADGGLAGQAETPPVVGDDPVPRFEQGAVPGARRTTF